MSDNPSNLAALTPKVTADNGGEFGGLLQPVHQAAYVAPPVATASTSTTPFGYTQAQADAIVANVRAISAALIAAGIMKAS